MKAREFGMLEKYLEMARDGIMSEYSTNINDKQELLKKYLLVEVAIDDISSNVIANNFDFLTLMSGGLEHNFVALLREQASKRGGVIEQE